MWDEIVKQLARLWAYPIFQLLVLLGATVFVGLVIKHWLLSVLNRLATKTDNDLDDRLINLFEKFYKWILLFVSFLLALRIFEISITPLLAGAGIFGVAIAYASKEAISNFLSGIFLIADRPIRIGDRVKIERIGRQWGAWGDVVDIGLRSTRVVNTDGVYVTYPNEVLANSIITNFSYSDKPVRIRVRCQLDLAVDLKEAVSEFQRVIDEFPEALEQPASSVVVRSLYDEAGGYMHQGILVEGRFYIPDITKRTPIRSSFLIALKTTFDAKGIHFVRPGLASDPPGLLE